MAVATPMKLIPPTSDQLERLRKEINLDETEHRRDTQTLKEWLEAQPHLPHDIEETILYSFIVGTKNSLERSKQLLDKYLTNRSQCPEFYSNRDPCSEAFRKQAKLFRLFVLPELTTEGYRVTIVRISSNDVSASDISLQMNAIHLLSSYDVRFQEDHFCAGDILVIDFKTTSISHIKVLLAIDIIIKYIHCFMKTLPVRVKKIIYFNMPKYVMPFLSVSKKNFPLKLQKRIITTNEDYPFLYNHIPAEILPTEFGGKAGSIDYLSDSWQLKLESYRDWFLKDMTRQVEESKRPQSSKTEDGFGIEGTFRTLSID